MNAQSAQIADWLKKLGMLCLAGLTLCNCARTILPDPFAQSPTAIATAWRDIIPPIVGGSVKPIVERAYPLGEEGEALRHLSEDRPFGKVVLAG